MKPTTLSLMVILVALLVAACGRGDDTRSVSPTGPTASGGIVVESAELKEVHGATNLDHSCHVRGVVRNDTMTNRNVTLTFTAFDKDGKQISNCVLGVCSPSVAKTETGGELVVPAGGRSKYRADLLAFQHCNGTVARLEITELKSEPVA